MSKPPGSSKLSSTGRASCSRVKTRSGPSAVTRSRSSMRRPSSGCPSPNAAHVHPPDGGQGLNTGVQDAVNLGWKLAQVVKRTSPERLLDTYHTERHPVGARVLRTTMAAVALRRADERTRMLRETFTELLTMDQPRKRFAAMLSGLDIHYDFGAGHPLLGRRMPDLDIVTADGARRVFTLLHKARPVLLNFDTPGSF